MSDVEPTPQSKGSLLSGFAATNEQAATLHPKRRPPPFDESEREGIFLYPQKRGGGGRRRRRMEILQSQGRHQILPNQEKSPATSSVDRREYRAERREAVTHSSSQHGSSRERHQPHHHRQQQPPQQRQQIPRPAPPTACVVCHVADAKYRCPKCLARYCSVACCRSHKDGTSSEKCRPNPAPPSDDGSASASRYRRELERAALVVGPQAALWAGTGAPNSPQNRRDRTSTEELDEGWKITEDMVVAMRGCNWLRDELRDQSLRGLIWMVAGASDSVLPQRRGCRPQGDAATTEQEIVLDRLKSELPGFRRFLDKLLVVAGALERLEKSGAGGAAPMELNEWLKRNVRTESEFLTLKPLSRPASLATFDNHVENTMMVPKPDWDRDSSGSSSSVCSSEESFASSDSSDCHDEHYDGVDEY